MSKWSSAFRDPRWQQKRLEIMQRDEFTCQSCQSSDKTLNVHHIYYEKNKAPWEYDDDMLITYCEECHETRHEMQKKILLGMAHCGLDEMLSTNFLLRECPHVLNIASCLYENIKLSGKIDNILINLIGLLYGGKK